MSRQPLQILVHLIKNFNVEQNEFYNGFPVQGTTPLPTGCGTNNETTGFYNCPYGLGSVNKTIGSARQIQMSLSMKF